MQGFSTNFKQTPVTTFTLFGFARGSRYWAFKQMGLIPKQLTTVSGLKFWRLLGVGHGMGFSLRPDFGRYGLLAVWENQDKAQDFFQNNRIFSAYKEHAYEVWTVTLIALSTHGLWSGVNPFPHQASPLTHHALPVAVLTRAAIRTTKLLSFWKHVPPTSMALKNAPGLLASIGVGEWPVIRQATISFWKDMDYMKDFAYKNDVHKNVIKKTREDNWYKEELFARFLVINTAGKWKGKNPLEISKKDHF